MRAALLPAWPELSLYFGLHPTDVGRYSTAEWSQYLDALEEIRRARPK